MSIEPVCRTNGECLYYCSPFNYIDYQMPGLIVEGNIQLSDLRERVVDDLSLNLLCNW